MRKTKSRKDNLLIENESEANITVKEVQDHYEAYGIIITVEQAEEIRIFIHTLSKIAFNQALREV
jgi:hypothetical protein